MDFPQSDPFTAANPCSLRCQRGSEWSREGCGHSWNENLRRELGLAEWRRPIEGTAVHELSNLLLRDGEYLSEIRG